MRALDIDENASDGAHEVVLCARGVAYALRDGTRLLANSLAPDTLLGSLGFLLRWTTCGCSTSSV